MCGIFGLVRNSAATHPERASAAFIALGHKSVERGRDSAGFALAFHAEKQTITGATRQHATARRTTLDHVDIVRDTVPFHDLWDDDTHAPCLHVSDVALGHTRWATQGKRDAIVNASPLVSGSLIGTHNGDIDTSTVPGRTFLPLPYGSTDTEVLFQSLDKNRRDRRKITNVLRGIEGRAALAWIDRNHPDRVYLARAALSPLSIAFDAENNFYWASNPRWFREIDAAHNGEIGFHSIELVKEGTLLTISLANTVAEIADTRTFTPQCRPSDSRLGDGIVWRGFDAADRDADKAERCHLVAPARTKYRTGSYTGASRTSATPAGTSTGTSGVSGGWTSTQQTGKVLTPGQDLPDYSDSLKGRWADHYAADGDQSFDDPWLSHLDDEDDLTDTYEDDEVDAALEAFVTGAYDESIVSILRNATTPSEIANLRDEFGLSSDSAFHLFRDLVTSQDS